MDETIEVPITIKVPRDWIDFCCRDSDVFMSGYCGYWMRGVRRDPLKGRLVWEFESDERVGEYFVDRMPTAVETRLHKAAIEAWEAGEKLPEYYHAIDKTVALKAYAEGVKRWGTNWYEEKGDGNTYDGALQLGLFGEWRYG